MRINVLICVLFLFLSTTYFTGCVRIVVGIAETKKPITFLKPIDKILTDSANVRVNTFFHYYSLENYDSLWDHFRQKSKFFNPHDVFLKAKLDSELAKIQIENGKVTKIDNTRIKRIEYIFALSKFLELYYDVQFDKKKAKAKFVFDVMNDTLGNYESMKIGKYSFDFELVKSR
jgi:hypothetical protein